MNHTIQQPIADIKHDRERVFRLSLVKPRPNGGRKKEISEDADENSKYKQINYLMRE